MDNKSDDQLLIIQSTSDTNRQEWDEKMKTTNQNLTT